MKNFLRVFIISLCLVVSQAPTTSLAQSNGETEIHDSSVDLVFSARSIDRYIGHLNLLLQDCWHLSSPTVQALLFRVGGRQGYLL